MLFRSRCSPHRMRLSPSTLGGNTTRDQTGRKEVRGKSRRCLYSPENGPRPRSPPTQNSEAIVAVKWIFFLNKEKKPTDNAPTEFSRFRPGQSPNLSEENSVFMQPSLEWNECLFLRTLKREKHFLRREAMKISLSDGSRTKKEKKGGREGRKSRVEERGVAFI